MKEAFWAIGLLVLSLFGLVLVNLFGNITVTDQLNYTTLKNTVEASMYDSLDQAYFDAGFCVCTDKGAQGSKWIFNDVSEYELADIKYVDGVETCNSTKKNCKVLFGEYRLDKKVFAEDVVRRFTEMINNNKNYRVIIQDVNEYPPKASVRIVSTDDEFSPTEQNSGGYDIVNQIDAIIETKNVQVGGDSNKNDAVCAMPTPTQTSTPGTKPYTCLVSAYDYKVDDYCRDHGLVGDMNCCWPACKEKYNKYKDKGAIGYECKMRDDGALALCEITWSERKLSEDVCWYEPPAPAPSESEGGGGGGSCSWHYSATVKCKIGSTSVRASGYADCVSAKSACQSAARSACPSGYVSDNCNSYQTWQLTDSCGGVPYSYSVSCGEAMSCAGHCTCRCQG